MRVKVRPMRKEGRLVVSSEQPKMPGFSGIFSVDETRDHAAGRTMVRAKLMGISTSANIDVLPELLDARVLWAQDSKMRVVGFERIAGIEYSQTWSVEVVAC